MSLAPHILISRREELPDAFVGSRQFDRFRPVPLEKVAQTPVPMRGAIVGVWGESTGDPFPDFLIVNDSELADTHAWLSSFMAALAPITQWCRVWTTTQFRELLFARPQPALGPALGRWVGAIVAECSVQGNSNVNLRELSGTAALTSASFAAARALAVWGPNADLSELARRHDDLSGRLREGSRPVKATQMLPLWYALSEEGWNGRPPADERGLARFKKLFAQLTSKDSAGPEEIIEATSILTDEFDLPELKACGQGPQTHRVAALDRLADRLGSGPRSSAVDAIMGYGASLIDPGAAVLPELLRRYIAKMPLAPLWAGAFAGAWSPIRVLSEFQGLGRIVAKEISQESDLFSKPRADIAFDELTRWIGSAAGGKVPVRGMVARSLNIELLPGIAAPIPLGRPEQTKVESASLPQPTSRQTSLGFTEAEANRSRAAAQRNPMSLLELTELVNQLGRRMNEFEEQVRKGSPQTKPPRGASAKTASKKLKGG